MRKVENGGTVQMSFRPFEILFSKLLKFWPPGFFWRRKSRIWSASSHIQTKEREIRTSLKKSLNLPLFRGIDIWPLKLFLFSWKKSSPLLPQSSLCGKEMFSIAPHILSYCPGNRKGARLTQQICIRRSLSWHEWRVHIWAGASRAFPAQGWRPNNFQTPFRLLYCHCVAMKNVKVFQNRKTLWIAQPKSQKVLPIASSIPVVTRRWSLEWSCIVASRFSMTFLSAFARLETLPNAPSIVWICSWAVWFVIGSTAMGNGPKLFVCTQSAINSIFFEVVVSLYIANFFSFNSSPI